MISLGTLLPSLLENFWALLPIRFTTIRQDEAGVRFFMGRYTRTVRHGIHVYAGWGLADIEAVTISEQAFESDIQTIDRNSANVVFCFHVTDPAKFILKVETGRVSVISLAEGHLGQLLLEDPEPEDIAEKLVESLREPCLDWGITLKSVQLQNYCQARPIRLMS